MRDPAEVEGVAGLLHVRPSLAIDSDTVGSDREIRSEQCLLCRSRDVCQKPVSSKS